MSGTTGTASAVVAVTPVEEKAADEARLLTALVNVCGVPHAHWKKHPVVLALKRDGISQFNMDFIDMTAADIDGLQHEKGGALVPLELNFKMTLRAFVAFCHHESHKKRGGVDVLDTTLPVQFKIFCNSECDPAEEIAPWGLAVSHNKGLSDWNKLVKPSSQDFKPFREANNWVDCKDVFLITLEAQNLAHLVDPSHVVTDVDLHKAQQSFLRKALPDNMPHHEAKLIVKSHSKTKDTALD